ncbi:MAG: hypothetical protein WCL50_00545 [Spirochaetota bacterium]
MSSLREPGRKLPQIAEESAARVRQRPSAKRSRWRSLASFGGSADRLPSSFWTTLIVMLPVRRAASSALATGTSR